MTRTNFKAPAEWGRRTGSFLRNDWKKFALRWRGAGPGRIPIPRGDLADSSIGAAFLEDPWPLPACPSWRDRDELLALVGAKRWRLYGEELALDPPGRISWMHEPAPGEPRAVRELNRLALCYFLVCPESSSDPQQAVEYCRKIIDSWMRANPYCKGTNWSDASEAAIRLMHLLWTLAAIAHRDRETARELAADWWPLLCAHVDFVRDRLTQVGSSGHRLILKLVSLLLFDRAANPTEIRWMKRLAGWEEELTRQLERQFDRNGMIREHSSGYLRITVQALELLHAAERGRHLALADRLEKLIGGGHRILRQLRFGETGSFEFGDGDDGNLFDGWSIRGTVNEDRPSVCEISGYLLSRTGEWDLFLDAAEDGLEPRFAHLHSDLLSFQAAYHGVSVVSDPGTYAYLGDPEKRNYLRSREAHAVFGPAGWEPVRFRGPFQAVPLRGKRTAFAGSSGEWTWIHGSHDCHPAYTMERGILCGPALGCLVIDRAVPRSGGRHAAAGSWEGRVRFAPGWKARSTGEEGWILGHPETGELSFRFSAPCPVRQRLQSAPFSPAFLSLTEALSISAILEKGGRPLLLTALTPPDRTPVFHWDGGECRIEAAGTTVVVRAEAGSALSVRCAGAGVAAGEACRFDGGG